MGDKSGSKFNVGKTLGRKYPREGYPSLTSYPETVSRHHNKT